MTFSVRVLQKKLSKRRPPGCLFRECVDGGYFFYLTSHAKPRLLGFNRGEQLNPLGPRHCCSMERRFECGPAGCVEAAEHLVPDHRGHYTCARRPAHHDVDYFFFLKKRQENATLADTIPAHNHMRGGHNGGPEEAPRLLPELHTSSHRLRGSTGLAVGRKPQPQQPQHRRANRPNRARAPAGAGGQDAPRHQRQQQTRLDQRPHRTRHHHQLQEQEQLQELPVRTPRPVRVRHKKVHHTAGHGTSHAAQDSGSSAGNQLLLPWD